METDAKKMMTLEAMRAHIETQVAALLERDPFWKKCYPCRNNGQCCSNDDPPALPVELAAIEAFLQTDREAANGLAENLRRGTTCIFYAPQASACLIHPVRPLVCRLTPFKGHVRGNEVTVYDGHPNTSCGYFLKRQLDILPDPSSEAPGSRFVTTETNTYFRVNALFEEHGLCQNAATESQHLEAYFRKRFL